MKYILLVLTTFILMHSNVLAQKKKSGYEIGSIAEDFSLKNVDGSMVSLSDYDEAAGFIICFTCNHCPFSIANEDRLIEINNEYAEKGYPIIAINPNDPKVNADDSFEKMIERSREKGFTFPYLFDSNQEIFPKYGATKTPHIYLLKKTAEGLVVEYIGAIDDSARDEKKVSKHYLKNALDDLISGRDVQVKETKAIGCSIKVMK